MHPTRGTRLPSDWTPSEQDLADANRIIAGTSLDPAGLADEFRDYWTAVAGAKGVKRDWSATWRNSCRRAAELWRSRHGGRNGNGQSGGFDYERRADDFARQIKQLEEEGRL